MAAQNELDRNQHRWCEGKQVCDHPSIQRSIPHYR